MWYAQLRYALLGLDESYQHVDVIWPRTETSLTNLVDQVVYEVKVTSYNAVGDSPSTTPLDIYVGEAGKQRVITRVLFLFISRALVVSSFSLC